MESDIKKLSMREILSRVGFPITINEFRNTYKFNVDLQHAMEFEEQLKQIKKMSEIERIICRYENIFDKEIYVFHLARLLEKDIENMKRAELLGQKHVEQLVFTNDVTGKNKRRFFVNAKNLLKKCDVIDIVMKKKSNGEFEIYSSIDFINQNTDFTDNLESEAIRKLGIIEQEVGLNNVLKYIENSDLSDICRYPNLAILLMVEKESLENKIKKHIQYIDLDKMLVLANAIYFYKYGENFYSFSKEEAYELNDFTQKISRIVGGRIKFVQTSRFYFTVDYSEIKEKIKRLLEHEENLTLKENSENVIEEAEQLTKEIIENEMPVEENILSEIEDAREEISIEENSLTTEISDEEDIFKTEIIKTEEEILENTLETEEKVIGEIFELANLEEKIEETTVESEMQEIEEDKLEKIETEDVKKEENKLEEVEAQETEIQENEVLQETEVQESESEMQDAEIQEAEAQEVEIQENEVEKVVEDTSVNITEEKQEYSNSSNNYINKFINDNAKIVMNFENRKSTIFKLDENYSQETLEDGTTIFSLPNKGCYIIETASNNWELGGKATYIINKDLFEAQRNSFIENKTLKPKELSILKLKNHKDVTKLVYTGWENTITTFFNMRTEEKYTQEEKDNINRIIEKING